MRTPEGRELWRKHGETIDLVFDLTPGSYSMRTLEAYLKESKKDETEDRRARRTRALSAFRGEDSLGAKVKKGPKPQRVPKNPRWRVPATSLLDAIDRDIIRGAFEEMVRRRTDPPSEWPESVRREVVRNANRGGAMTDVFRTELEALIRGEDRGIRGEDE
jgi:hypothetical protein